MLFTSYEFVAFLCAMLLLYFLTPSRLQWVTLLVGSYVFYALCGYKYLIFIGVTTVSSYAVSMLLSRAIDRENAYVEAMRDTISKEQRKEYRAKAKKKRFYILIAGLVFNFGILAVLKYTPFAVNNVNTVIKLFGGKTLGIPSLLLPMGISFYTFQTMGYLIDVYRARQKAQKNIFKLALFVSFFPQLVQGPISRFSEIGDQLVAPHKFCARTFVSGAQRILWGYFKKLVIADRILIAMNTLLDDTARFDGAYVLLLIVFYSIQIYADFTGGIDITIGIAEAMGIRLPENFDRPFSSKSTKEYWRRWHITMGSWFRDYIFVPVSVTKPMMRLNRKMSERFGRIVASKTVAYLASGLTWLLTGIWHGAGWNFIVWGLLNCLVIIVSELLEPTYKKFHERFPRLTGSRPYESFMSVRTFLLMGIIRSLDCYRNVGLTFRMWGSMLTFRGIGEIFSGGIFDLGLNIYDYIIVFVAIAVVFLVSRMSARMNVREWLYAHPVLSAVICGVGVIVILTFGTYGVGYDANQFIYNQF